MATRRGWVSCVLVRIFHLGFRGYFLWGGVTGLKARYLISSTTSICEIYCGGGGVLEKDKYHPA